jgi:hypothetical protein
MRNIKVKQIFFESFQEIQAYILQYSEKNALKFKNDLSQVIDKIIFAPESFTPERNLLSRRRIYRYAIYKKN